VDLGELSRTWLLLGDCSFVLTPEWPLLVPVPTVYRKRTREPHGDEATADGLSYASRASTGCERPYLPTNAMEVAFLIQIKAR
jgi:hypothetical protein